MLEIIYYTGGIAQTNGWVIRTQAGTLGVDAPDGFAAWLDRKGIRLDALYLTHQHFDHVQDAEAIRTAHGCPVAAFAAYSRSLTLEDLFGMVSGMSVSVPAFEVTQVLEGEREVTLADTLWQTYHVPGHSPDSLCLYNAGLNLLIGGDVLFADSIGRSDFPGGSHRLLVSGIKEKLLPLPDATRVLPGHGPETTIGIERVENPYLQDE